MLVPIVRAEAATTPPESSLDEESDDEANVDDPQTKKKSKKEKVGFRDRKVMLVSHAHTHTHIPWHSSLTTFQFRNHMKGIFDFFE